MASLVFAPAMSPARSISVIPGDDARRWRDTGRRDRARRRVRVVHEVGRQRRELDVHQDLAVLDGRDRGVLGLLQTLGHGLGRIGEVVVLRRDFRRNTVLAHNRTFDHVRVEHRFPSRLDDRRQGMAAYYKRC